MNDDFAKRVRTAAMAGWKTILIFAIGLLVSWGCVLVVLNVRPAIVMKMIGPGPVDWDELQRIYVWFMGVCKLIVLTALMLVVWLTFWARGLKRAR